MRTERGWKVSSEAVLEVRARPSSVQAQGSVGRVDLELRREGWAGGENLGVNGPTEGKRKWGLGQSQEGCRGGALGENPSFSGMGEEWLCPERQDSTCRRAWPAGLDAREAKQHKPHE